MEEKHPSLYADLLTRTEAATELGITPRTLAKYHLLRCGPPRIKTGGRIWYRRASLRTWIERQEHDPAVPAAERRRRA